MLYRYIINFKNYNAPFGDDHTVSHRMSGKPSQTVLVCNSKGVVCDYNVDLD